MREIHLAVFDLDNTLWDNFAANEQAVSGLIHDLSRSSGVSLEAVALGMRQVLEENDGKLFYYPGTIPHNRALADAHPGVDLAARHAPEAEAFDQALLGLMTPYEGMREVLQELKARGIRLACYSESPSTKALGRLKALGLADMFELICTSANVKEKHRPELPVGYAPADCGLAVLHRVVTNSDGPGPKTHPEILLRILADLGVEPRHAAMIGDHPERDVAMAMKGGVLGIHAAWGEGSLKDLALTGEIHPYIRHVRQSAMQRGGVAADLVAESPKSLLRFLRGPGRKNP